MPNLTVRQIAKKFTKSNIDLRRLRRILSGTQQLLSNGRVRTATGDSYQLFSVVGFGKSGTNWLSALLNLHPHINCKGEFNFHVFQEAFTKFTANAGHIGRLDPFRSTASAALQGLYAQVLLCMAAEKPTATHLGERTPRPLDDIISGAPLLWLVRDGRDVIISYTYHYLRLKPGFNIQHWTPDIQKLFWNYGHKYHTNPPTSCFETARELLAEKEWVSFVAHIWGKRVLRDYQVAQRLGTQCLPVKYEDLHHDLSGTMAAVYRFLGLDPALADQPSRDTNTVPGFGREDALNFYRKGEIGDWKQYATPLFIECVNNQCSDALRLMGYE